MAFSSFNHEIDTPIDCVYVYEIDFQLTFGFGIKQERVKLNKENMASSLHS